MFNLINDGDMIVKKNSLNGFSTLAETFPGVFLTNPKVIEIIKHLIDLSRHKDEDIQLLSLTILTYVTDDLKAHPSCPLTKYPDPILQELI